MLAVCTLSHGNADPERGFSFNKHMLSVHGISTDQKTIEALRLVKDYINLHGVVSKIKVRKNLIKRCSIARQRTRPESSESCKERGSGSKKREKRKEARQKRKLLESELRNDLQGTNKNLKLSNE